MKTIKQDEIVGSCTLCKTTIHDNDYWVNDTAVVINATWLCGECLANLWSASTDDTKTANEKIANAYGISIDPKTGKLKKAKALNRDQTLVKT